MTGKFSAGLLWVCVLLRYEQMLPATEAFLAHMPAEDMWPTAGTMSISEFAETQTDLLLGASLDTFEERVENLATTESRTIGSSPTLGVPSPKPEVKGSRKPAVFKGLGAILALVVCVWFLSADKKTGAVSEAGSALGDEASEPFYEAAEGASTQDYHLASKLLVDDELKERRRLERVRGLLPSASRLAAAVGTNEAQKQLINLQKALSAASLAAKSPLNDNRVEESLTCAMDALRSLHRTAVQQATVLAQDGAEVPVLSLLDSGELEDSVKNELQHVIDDESVAPFTVYMRSLQDSVIDMSRRFERSRERLLAATEFTDEKDENMLVSAAVELEWMRTLRERKRQVVSRATTMKKCAVCGIRVSLKFEVEERIRIMQGSVELLGARLSLISNAIEDSFETSSAPKRAVEDTGKLHTVRKKLADVKELLNEVKKEKEAVHVSSSVGSAAAAFRKAEQIMGEAQAMLDDCWDATNDLPPPNQELSTGDIAILARSAAKAQAIADEQKAGVVSNVAVVYNRSSHGVQEDGTVVESIKRISPLVAEQLRAQAKETEEQMMWHYQDMQEAATQLQTTDELTDGMILLGNVHEHVPNLVECNKRAVTLALDSYLYTLLQEDIQASMKAVSRVFSGETLFTAQNRMHIEQLRRGFNKAKTAVSTATTLTEAAEAAGKMRMNAEGLTDFARDRWTIWLDPS